MQRRRAWKPVVLQAAEALPLFNKRRRLQFEWNWYYE